MLFILYVSDQPRSKAFYVSVLGIEPYIDVPGMSEFAITPDAHLGLIPERGIATILGDGVPHPSSGTGIPRCELYLLVEDPEAHLARAIQHGATPISPVSLRVWGDDAGYCADPDGHVVAFAREHEEEAQ